MLYKKLKLNPARTKLLIISPARSQLITPESLLFGESLAQVSVWVRNLGFIFDSNTDLRKQINQVKRKVINDLLNISRIPRFVDKSSRRKLVHDLILRKIDFFNSLYYGLRNCDLKALQMLLNAAARVVAGFSHFSSLTRKSNSNLYRATLPSNESTNQIQVVRARFQGSNYRRT